MANEKSGIDSKLILKYSLIFVCVAILVATIFLVVKNLNPTNENILTCNDGTFYDSCSLNKPYFCEKGILVEKSSVCGCPKGWTISGEVCSYELQKNPRVVSLKYILNGKEEFIDLTIYDGYSTYFDSLPKPYRFFTDEKSTRRDYKLIYSNDVVQREMLIPLVVEIQNRAESREDQVRIAVSLVQNIPYGSSNETYNFMGNKISYTRYPYEVISDNSGLCEEKSSLLLFLLKELNYGTATFYFQLENHEAVGIKCPVEEGFDNIGYCFVETTGPAIISDDNLDYSGFGKLSKTNYQIFITSNGYTLSEDMPEYDDADKMAKLRKFSSDGKINFFNNKKLNSLKEKYGLNGEYGF
jgi:hypothetical protein